MVRDEKILVKMCLNNNEYISNLYDYFRIMIFVEINYG